MATEYRFSFGPWNIHEGADPFGPTVRQPRPLAEKMDIAVRLGFQALQFHDDDVVPADMPAGRVGGGGGAGGWVVGGRGLGGGAIASAAWPRSSSIRRTSTSNSATERRYAIDRSKRAIDIARLIGTRDIVWWPAREGTYMRESKDPQAAFGYLLEYADALLEYDAEIRILGEMKPNEPMDITFCPTTGHFLALAY